jgi:hypothetical protein
MPPARRSSLAPASPAWERLYATAESQTGLFTLTQAKACGYSS